MHGRVSRERSSAFLVDGMRFVAQALKHDVPIETLIVCPDLLLHPFAQKLARQVRRTGTTTLDVNQEVYFSLSQAEEPQGIAAVVRQQWQPRYRVDPAEGLCGVVVKTVQTPGAGRIGPRRSGALRRDGEDPNGGWVRLPQSGDCHRRDAVRDLQPAPRRSPGT
jgi:hypothetical protein